MTTALQCEHQERILDYQEDIGHFIPMLDQHRGMYMSSGIEYPGRYTRWDFAFIDPPLECIAIGRQVMLRALTPRGVQWLAMLGPIFAADDAVTVLNQSEREWLLTIAEAQYVFPEEWRSRQPTVMTPIRSVIQALKGHLPSVFGFYGAMGYELIFQFDAIEPAFERQGDEKVYHLFFVDELYAVDRRKEQSIHYQAELSLGECSTKGSSATVFDPVVVKAANHNSEIVSDIDDHTYGEHVTLAREQMRLGNLFEAVLSRQFSSDYSGLASDLFLQMRKENPSPYEFYCQMGDEQLVGTSPEMFVRVKGDRIESCPISGTARRGQNAMEDEANIRGLLNSEKDETELTMCTDVDRNDKSRMCHPGSVKLLARRTIERYIGLFHTVDHVEGRLLPQYDGLDGFLSHMWAVTLTGAPKKHAVQFIENTEKTSRRWYGGAVGCIGVNGDINSCITIRTLHLHHQKAHYRVGATLVWDSDPQAESDETHTKATPYYRVLGKKAMQSKQEQPQRLVGKGYRAVMVDYEDSFVHTLASYFRQCGMEVVTYRAGVTLETILAEKPDLVIHSPGPGRPADFKMPEMIVALAEQGVPQFGVCLGLQGIIEAFGGQLSLLPVPRHGKLWHLQHSGQAMMQGLAQQCQVAAYHSIIANRQQLPECLEVIAENEQGNVMAVRHREYPIQAVQFHPESILTMKDDVGLKMIENVIEQMVGAAS